MRDSLADRYRIERELGQGGMATVYVIPMPGHPRRWNKARETVEELEGADADHSTSVGTLPEQALETGAVMGCDPHRRVQAEATGAPPDPLAAGARHVLGVRLGEQAAPNT